MGLLPGCIRAEMAGPVRMDDDGATGFLERAVAVIQGLAPGEVMTYGEVAREAGRPGAARAVGNLLARGEGQAWGALPWWRVVAAGGRLVPGHEREHTRRLRAEGVTVNGNRVAGMR